MRNWITTFAIILAWPTGASAEICKGASDVHEFEITVTDSQASQPDIPISDYSVLVTRLADRKILVEKTFPGGPLVYGRGMAGVARTDEFSTLKVIFDGARGLAMYVLTNQSEVHQVPMTCIE